MAPYQRPKITYPVDGMVLAIDPDIPEELQGVVLEANSNHEKIVWTLDNLKLEQTGETTVWHPSKRGLFHLAIQDQNGTILDSVRVSVR